MHALILFSHGSLLCGAGEALEAHAARLRASDRFGLVGIGYLNYLEPSFAAAVDEAAAAGATRITVAPYFLVPGFFVTKSLPDALAAARARHPQVEFAAAAALDDAACLADALIASAADARPASQWRAVLERALAACRRAPSCPLFRERECLTPPPAPDRGTLPGREGPVALLALAHGSPRPEANDGLFRALERIRARGDYPIVHAGFLECNAPSIPEAIDACVAEGATRIVAAPYFLHPGTHVGEDLPALLEEGQARHPAAEFLLGEYIGRSPRLTDLLAERAEETLYARGWAAR